MVIQFFLRYPLLAILIHIGLGFLMDAQPMIIGIYYAALTGIGLLEIAATHDRAGLAAYYGLYLTGMEILSRMSNAPLFWEFGKYADIAIFGFGSFFGGSRQQRPYLLLAYFVLMLPGIAVAAAYGGVGEDRIRDLTSQYLSGPAVLLFSGWYFYQRSIHKDKIVLLLRVGILPSIAVVTFLFLGKSLSEIDFVVGSNFAASGGFGPNQVSSALGWGIVLVVMGMLFNASATSIRLLDIGLLLLLVFRGLLTFSRGGMLGAFGSIGLAMLALFFISNHYRQRMKSILPRMAGGILLLAVVAYFANELTDNFLLYRYQGKSTSEAIMGKGEEDRAYFSGRENILEGELQVFAENPVLGIGLGRGTLYRENEFRSEAVASHTEFTRMLGEHGIFGLFAILCAFVIFPFRHFRRLPNDLTRQWMLTFFSLSAFTLLHSGMRMSLASVAFGLAFIIIIPDKPKSDV